MRVQVTEGKITVNVRKESKENRLWFELARGLSLRELEFGSQLKTMMNTDNVYFLHEQLVPFPVKPDLH